jgi:hypothetical protein
LITHNKNPSPTFKITHRVQHAARTRNAGARYQ